MFFTPPPTHYKKYTYESRPIQEFGELKTFAGYYIIFSDKIEIKIVPYHGFDQKLKVENVPYNY